MPRCINALGVIALVLQFSSSLALAANVPARSAPAPAADSAQSLSVISFNMEHKDRPSQLKVVAEHMKSELSALPDFICCQEVVFERGGSQDNTAAVLADDLGYYCRGTKRTSDREGVAIVSKYPFTYYAARNLKSQTSPLLIGFRRVSIMGEFDVPNLGRVRVVDVHFTNWGFEHHVRRKQLAETLQWIKDRQAEAPAAVTILGGDFNAKAWWDEMKQIKQPGEFGNLAFKDFNSQANSFGLPGTPSKRIDHLFVYAPQLEPRLLEEKLFWRDGLRDGGSRFYVSDHLLLMQRYEFKASAVADIR